MGISRFWFATVMCGAVCIPAVASAQQDAPERDASFPRCEMSVSSHKRFNTLYGEARIAQIDRDHDTALIKLHRATKMCVEAELFHYMSKSYEALGDTERALEFARAYEEQLEVRAHSARADRGERVLAHREVARLELVERTPRASADSKRGDSGLRPERLDLSGDSRRGGPSRPPTPLFEDTRREKKTKLKGPKRLKLSTQRRAGDTRRKLGEMFSDSGSVGARYTFETSPAGASVRVGGDFVGVTPYELVLRPGEHVVEVSKSGWSTLRRVVRVRDGEPTRVMLSMTRSR